MKGKTKSGFTFEVNDNALNDYELLEALVKIDRGDYTYLTDVVNRLLGENKKKFMDHIRDESGAVPVKKVAEAVGEIFQALNKKQKNSSSSPE